MADATPALVQGSPARQRGHARRVAGATSPQPELQGCRALAPHRVCRRSPGGRRSPPALTKAPRAPDTPPPPRTLPPDSAGPDGAGRAAEAAGGGGRAGGAATGGCPAAGCLPCSRPAPRRANLPPALAPPNWLQPASPRAPTTLTPPRSRPSWSACAPAASTPTPLRRPLCARCAARGGAGRGGLLLPRARRGSRGRGGWADLGRPWAVPRRTPVSTLNPGRPARRTTTPPARTA